MNTRWKTGAYLGAMASLLLGMGNFGVGVTSASSGASAGVASGRITHHSRLVRHADVTKNKGTLKISENSLYQPPAGDSNEPHISCPFWIQGYYMDAATGTMTVTVQNPVTGTQVAGQNILVQGWSANNLGFFNTGPFGTQTGFLSGGHYKVTSTDTRNPKTKVFWVRNCAAPPTVTPTETLTSVPTSTPTLAPPTATATSQPTATPTRVATSTPTSVPVPTSTPTLVPTQAPLVVPTNTPVPPTATNTPVLGGAARPTARPTPPCPPVVRVRTVIHNIVHTRIVTRTRTVIRTRIVTRTRTVVHNIVHRVVVIRRVIVIQRVVATPTPRPNPCGKMTPTANGGCGLG